MAGPALQTGQWSTNLRHVLDREGGLDGIGITYQTLMDLFPVGAVWLWHDEATIPTGWEIVTESAGRFLLALATGGTFLAQSGAATHTHVDHVVTQPNNHVVTQPTAHGTNTTLIEIQDTGSGTFVMTAYSLTNNHTGTAVDAHSGTAVDPHTAADHTPPAVGVFLIRKVS